MSDPVQDVGIPPVDSLDFTILKLQEEGIAFVKDQTGIKNDEEFQKHVLRVQTEALAIYPYDCIRSMRFLSLKLANHHAYETVLKIGKERPNAVFLDLGCCMGTDARRAVADGYPIRNMLLCDLQPGFFDLGHRLFKTNRDTYPIHFLQGNILDADFLEVSPDSEVILPNIEGQPPSLDVLTSLTPLQRHVSVIHTSSFFHLFDEAQQFKIARLLRALLSLLPGSIILGTDRGLPDQKDNSGGIDQKSVPGTLVVHSPATWKEMWVGQGGVFKPEEVVLNTRVVIRRGPSHDAYLLYWSITRA